MRLLSNDGNARLVSSPASLWLKQTQWQVPNLHGRKVCHVQGGLVLLQNADFPIHGNTDGGQTCCWPSWSRMPLSCPL